MTTAPAPDSHRSLFRAELRRRWPARSIWRVVAILAVIIAAQVGFTYGAVHRHSGGARGVLTAPEFPYLQALGLYSGSLLTLLMGGFFSQSGLLNLAAVFFSVIPGALTHFLLPAYAAGSIAPDRKYRYVAELLANGFRPGTILTAKGCAAVGPLLIISGCFLLLFVVAQAFGLATGVRPLVVPGPDYFWAILIAQVVVTPLTWVLQAAILVCLSALSRRVWTALAACYVTEFFLLPVLDHLIRNAAHVVRPVTNVQDLMGHHLVAMPLGLAAQGLVLAIVLPLALRAIASDAPTTPRQTLEAPAHSLPPVAS